MTPSVAVVVVNHRSAPHARRCVESLRTALAADGISGEIVLVDCGSGPEEARDLSSAGADLLLALPENRGYSGGVNAGLARTRAAFLVLSNADVVYRPGSLAPLLEALEDARVGAAAPLCLWDEEGTLQLPPGFAPGFFRDAAQLLAGRWPAFDARRFAAAARETLRLWERGGRTRHLSGAVLAVRREVFDRVGRFDERFPFEYEETEWEDRIRAAGLDLLFVPRSRVRHLWAQSAAASPESAARRAQSRWLYRERRYGAGGRAILDSIERARRPAPALPRRDGLDFPPSSGASLALSPNPSLLPFAGGSLERGLRLTSEAATSAGRLYCGVFRDSDGRLLERFVREEIA